MNGDAATPLPDAMPAAVTAAGADVQAALDEAVVSRRIEDPVRRIVQRLRQPDYSVDDLLRDVAATKDRTAKPRDNSSAANWLLLDAVVTECLATTAAVHEAAIETMAHGFCEIDADGLITFANPTLQAMMPGAEGAHFANFFGAKATVVENALATDGCNDLLQLRIEVGEQSCPVLVEVGGVPGRTSSFAIVTDLSQAEAAEQRIIAEMPVAMMRLDDLGYIRLANDAALALLRRPREAIVDRPVRDLLTLPESRDTLTAERQKRAAGQGSRYELAYQVPGETHIGRLDVVAMPILGYGGHEVVGTLAMLSSLDEEHAARDVLEIVGRESDPHQLFAEVMTKLAGLVPFDRAYLTVYSADRAFTRAITTFPRINESATRWYPLSPEMRALVSSKETWGNLDALPRTAKPGDASPDIDPAVQEMMTEGFRSYVLLRSYEGTFLRAGLSLLSKTADQYSASTIERLTRVGMIDATNAILLLEETRERSFEQELLKAMAPLDDGAALAATVCQRLVAYYGWQNVAAFRVNVLQRQFELMAQHAPDAYGISYPDRYVQPIELGLIGRTFATGKPVKLRCRDDGSEEARIYVSAAPDTQSELCLPIRLGEQVVWILCIDDRRRYAFEGPDEEVLARVATLLEGGLDRVLRTEMLNQVLDVVPDGVVLIDPAGIVMHCNDKARELLGASIVGATLADRIEDTAARESLAFPAGSTRVTEIVDDKGDVRTVSMRHFTHRDAYNHRVVVLEDVTKRQADAVINRVDQTLSDAFKEMRPSLTMVASYLNQIARTAEDGGLAPVATMARKAVEQLSGLSVSYEGILQRIDDRLYEEATDDV